MPQLPHTPSYDSQIERASRTLKRRMEDGSFVGRVKSSPQFTWEVQYKSRPIQEMLDIQDFYDVYGEVLPFQYEDLLSGTIYDVTFDSPIKGSVGSFDSVDFGFTLKEYVGGTITLPTISELPTANLRVDYDFDDGFVGIDPEFYAANSAPNYLGEIIASSPNAPSHVVGLNGYKVGRFDGVNDQLTSNDDITLNDFTMYVVFKPTAVTPTAYERVVDLGFSAGGIAIMRGNTEADTFGASIMQPNYPYGSYETYADDAWHVMYCGRLNDTSYLFKDGATAAIVPTSSALIDENLYVGGNDPVSTAYFKGDIARIIIYSSFLSVLRRHQIFNFLKTYYDIA